QHRRLVAEPEPEQEQRSIGEPGDRCADADQREEDVLRAPRAPHGEADRHAGHGRKREAGREPQQRVEHGGRQDAVRRQPDEGLRDVLERREQLTRKDAEMRSELPEQRHHQERKRVAREHVQPAFAARRRRSGSHDARRRGGRKVAHDVTIVRKSRVGQAHSASRPGVEHRKERYMGQLVDGRWMSGEVLRQHDEKGLYFKRPAVFRHRVAADGASGFPAESGRYHLYCAVACPWAHRAVLFRVLKELTPHITLWNTFQEVDGEGWSFGRQGHVVPGTEERVRWLHELYTIADPACTTRVTVPTLW